MTRRSRRSSGCWPKGWRSTERRRSARLLAHADMRVRQEAQFELRATGPRTGGSLSHEQAPARSSPGTMAGPGRRTVAEEHAGPNPRDLGPGADSASQMARAAASSLCPVLEPLQPTVIPRSARRPRKCWANHASSPRSISWLGCSRTNRRASDSSPRWLWARWHAPRRSRRSWICCETTPTKILTFVMQPSWGWWA